MEGQQGAGRAGRQPFLHIRPPGQDENTVRRARYADADLFDDPDNDPCHRYVVLRDLKMLEALEADTKENTV